MHIYIVGKTTRVTEVLWQKQQSHLCGISMRIRERTGSRMENMNGMLAILGVCLIVLIIGALGRKVEWLVNFILRAVMGTVGIYFVNYFLESQQLSFAVGINPLTVLTSGFLGFPGVVVLYGIHFFKML